MNGKMRVRRRIFVAAGIAVLLGLGAGGYAIAAGPASPQLRLATVGYADVDRTLSTTGVVQPVNTANLNFPVAGRVSKVLVSAGQQVSVGQQLATLDTSSLTSQLASAQASVAADQAKLAADEASQTSGQVAPAAFVISGQPTTNIHDIQQKLLSDQQKADAALATERTAVAAEHTACASSPGTPGLSADCTAALQSVLADQSDVSTAQNAVSTDEAALNKALASTPPPAAAAPPTSSAPKSAPRTQQSAPKSGGQKTSGAGNSVGGKAKSGPASAQQLSADQAAVDAANAQVTVARQSLAQAQLVSPIAGTVGAISLSEGQSVSGGNQSTPQIEVLGQGTDEVNVTVDDTQVGLVKVGDQVDITPDGSKNPLTGSVVSIGMMSTATSGSASYPVTIGISGTSPGLFAGSGADTNIVLDRVSHVVAVPSSAVHGSTVTLLRKGKPATVRVGLGAVGAVYTQITSGLQPGDQVMLANLAEPMPTSGSSSVRSLTRG